MCGIAGIWDRRRRDGGDALGEIAAALAQALLHRGPDAGGVWRDSPAGPALSPRRLAIADPQPAGVTAMVSPPRPAGPTL